MAITFTVKPLLDPDKEIEQFYREIRYKLTLKMLVSYLVALSIITSISYFSFSDFFGLYLAVIVLIGFSLLYLLKTKDFTYVSGILMSAITGVIIYSVFFIPKAPHIIEMLWMVIVVLYLHFTLGKTWSLIFLAINTIIYAVYFNLFFYSNISVIEDDNPIRWVIMSVEFTFIMFLIGYILNQFTVTNRYVEAKRMETYSDLQKEKEVVEKQNCEKTVLLQEIHHRVKNNLQVIISLLRIQSQDLKSDEAKKSFSEAISRIMTMSLIHQKMYEREELSRINLNDYMSTLIDDMLSSSVTSGEVTFELTMETEEIGSKTIAPLALIINELVSNSLKHAFNGDGKIEIQFRTIDEEKFELTYQDSGSWKEVKEGTFGMQLIDIFTEQMEGEYKRETTEKGTTYRFLLADLDNSNNSLP